MATPPAPSARSTPTGRRIPDGFKTLITWASQPALGVWEKQVKPSSPDGGELIDISTMHNTKWHSMYPRTLIKMDEGQAVCGFDPDVLPTIYTLINLPDTITITYPDGSTECYYGVLRKVEHSEHTEGEFPLMTLTFQPTNIDPASNFVEEGPVFTPASGT